MSDETIYKAQTSYLQRRTVIPAGVLLGGAALLILVGILPISLAGALWPLVIVAAGLLLLWPAWKSTPDQQSRLNFLAVPGAVVVALGALVFVMNLLGHWASWMYAWFLLPAAAIGGVMYWKRFEPKHRVHDSGYKALRALVALALGLGLFFELLVFRTFGPWWPLLVVGFGVILFVRNQRRKTS
jgi:hypothetical protein